MLSEQEKTSVLGLKWLIQSDESTYEVKNSVETEKLTKRIILSKIGQLYDPNGYISPVVVKAKLLMQKLWQTNLDWDEAVSEELRQDWVAIGSKLKNLESIRIPRWLRTHERAEIQLHGFCDASAKAYGAVIFARITNVNGAISTSLLISKSRVAPIKVVTIPQLELTAAELLSNLYAYVASAMEYGELPYFLWCDSTIALQWMNKPLTDLKLFVANRVNKIRQNTNIERWFHIRTTDNPADLVSRGLFANDLWWNGPSWLKQDQPKWPKPLEWKSCRANADMELELKVHSIFVNHAELQITIGSKDRCDLLKFSNNLRRLTRIRGQHPK